MADFRIWVTLLVILEVVKITRITNFTERNARCIRPTAANTPHPDLKAQIYLTQPTLAPWIPK